MSSVRCHHYEFAHVALRNAAFQQPIRFMNLLATPDAQDFMISLLQQVVEHCKDRGEIIDFDVSNTGLYLGRVGGHPCAIVEMPPPKATAEAFYVASVLLMPTEEPRDPKEVKLRYFTLEKTFAYGDPPRTVLGEWAADQGHVNHGIGPEPRLELFVEAISALLEGGYTPPEEAENAKAIFSYRVRLLQPGSNRVKVMALLREYWQLSPAQARAMVDSQRPLLGAIGHQKREALEEKFREAGALVEFEAVEEP